jgi:HEAT repeat protein
MIARLSQSDSVAARNAADILGEFKRIESIPALSAALSSGFTGEARAAIAHALGTIGDASAQPALEQALGASEPVVRAAALSALRSLRGYQASSGINAVLPLLSDADESVRQQAVYSAGFLRAGAAVSGLQNLLLSDPSATVRKKAAWALGEIGQAASAAASALARAAQGDASPLVRSLAQAALGRLNR